MRLPRVMRMKNRGEFARVRNRGKSVGGRFLVLGFLAENPPPPVETFKFGVILTRKVGNAVQRNRIRRRVKSILSEMGDEIGFRGYLVTIARRGAAAASFEELRRDGKKLARRAGILSDTPTA